MEISSTFWDRTQTWGFADPQREDGSHKGGLWAAARLPLWWVGWGRGDEVTNGPPGVLGL